ncbi:unnamed protein product [Amoebophrya sp. A120]|nr:unnamed protein product [Amoebophrya sp. A120]|eukprot:GSA120T00004253001.1
MFCIQKVVLVALCAACGQCVSQNSRSAAASSTKLHVEASVAAKPDAVAVESISAAKVGSQQQEPRAEAPKPKRRMMRSEKNPAGSSFVEEKAQPGAVPPVAAPAGVATQPQMAQQPMAGGPAPAGMQPPAAGSVPGANPAAPVDGNAALQPPAADANAANPGDAAPADGAAAAPKEVPMVYLAAGASALILLCLGAMCMMSGTPSETVHATPSPPGP